MIDVVVSPVNLMMSVLVHRIIASDIFICQILQRTGYQNGL